MEFGTVERFNVEICCQLICGIPSLYTITWNETPRKYRDAFASNYTWLLNRLERGNLSFSSIDQFPINKLEVIENECDRFSVIGFQYF